MKRGFLKSSAKSAESLYIIAKGRGMARDNMTTIFAAFQSITRMRHDFALIRLPLHVMRAPAANSGTSSQLPRNLWADAIRGTTFRQYKTSLEE